MKYIKAFEYSYNKFGDKYDVGDIVVCVKTYNDRIILNRKYKVLDIKGGDMTDRGLYVIEVQDMETDSI